MAGEAAPDGGGAGRVDDAGDDQRRRSCRVAGPGRGNGRRSPGRWHRDSGHPAVERRDLGWLAWALLFGGGYGATVGVGVGLAAGLAVGAATRARFVPLRDPARHRWVVSVVCAIQSVFLTPIVLVRLSASDRWEDAVLLASWDGVVWIVALVPVVGVPAWWGGRRFAAWYEEVAPLP